MLERIKVAVKVLRGRPVIYRVGLKAPLVLDGTSRGITIHSLRVSL